MEVDFDCDIRGFVTHAGVEFKIGRGFYELTRKSVKVQDHKEVVLEDRESGEMYTGAKAREMLGLPTHGTVTLNPKKVTAVTDDYHVYIQSTSYNRKLLAGSWFLYEVPDFERMAA